MIVRLCSETFSFDFIFLSHISSALDIEVPTEDLLNPPPQAAKNHLPKRPVMTTSLFALITYLLPKWMRRVTWLVVCVF